MNLPRDDAAHISIYSLISRKIEKIMDVPEEKIEVKIEVVPNGADVNKVNPCISGINVRKICFADPINQRGKALRGY